LDPLDPLTEIVKSGQAYSPLIFLERLIWLMIGFFFIGAISTNIRNNLIGESKLKDKSIFFKFNKKENNQNNSLSSKSNENISKN